MPNVYEPLTLEIEPPYIGSAFSPTVDIDETADDITVTITDSRGEHSYTVDKTDDAIAAANAAATNANNAASTAEAKGNQAVDIATTAAQNADAKAALADAAASTATTAAGNADDAASAALAAKVGTEAATHAANTATSNAQAATSTATTAAQNADAKAALANTAASNADAKAVLANTAAANADAKATLADNAATSATTAAGQASTAAGNANDAATAANAAADAADAAREAIQDELAAKADADGYYQLLGAGLADALPTGDATVNTFSRRASDHDGACRITSLRGNTVRWNQLASLSNLSPSAAHGGITLTNNGDGSVTVNGTATEHASPVLNLLSVVSGHKYLIKGGPSGGSATTYYLGISGIKIDYGSGGIWASTVTSNIYSLRLDVDTGQSLNNVKFWPQCFDLTEIFGAGNEPQSVEEFERMYPADYYPYDAGSLLSVNIEGIKSVGFNQWDEEWERCIYGATGVKQTSDVYIGSKNKIRVFPSTVYSITRPTGYPVYVAEYDSADNFIKRSVLYQGSNPFAVFTTTANTGYIAFCLGGANTPVTSYNHDICINLSDSSRNGTYEPYRGIVREIPPSTLFPDGILKSAGSAYDERTPTRDIKRIGAVDLGTLNWATLSTPEMHIFRTTINDKGIKGASSNTVNGNGITPSYEIMPWSPLSSSSDGKFAISTDSSNRLVFVDSDYSTVEAFIAAVTGEMLYYELATPTETPIDPPLNLAYPTEQGGTESIVIPEGEQSAAPTMAVVYAYNADGVRDISQAIIANIEGAKASTNYAIGGYFVHAGKLYKATSAIATGETINPGTNCVQTTVMAELLALTA